MDTLAIPGIYRREIQERQPRPFGTGLPAFVGYCPKGPFDPTPISGWDQFISIFGIANASYTPAAVRGFFQNEGKLCYVVRQDETREPHQQLSDALMALDVLTDVDLICLPDIMRAQNSLVLQQQLIDWCDRGATRFALLDAPLQSTLATAVAQRRQLIGRNAALYYPWVDVASLSGPGIVRVPPCGHIAGMIARTDRTDGFFAAPTNETLEGVLDVGDLLTDEQQASDDPFGVVNCIRVFPGRGIRPWGARTLSGQPDWRYINVCRLFLTFHRWLQGAMAALVYEPNTPVLWARIRRTISGYLDDLHRRGGLAGTTEREAYFVRCDASTTPPAIRDNGQVIAEIGIAPVIPAEFIVVTLLFGAGEVLIGGDQQPPEMET
ncbi:MAG TPA: phage tail sheath subtilisin-like domain-containing protein [Bryocella sp.]|nr:phage tail sheath subtilisin-like domain-containing protein [Bryocella sp.]